MTLNLCLFHNTEDTQCNLLRFHMPLWAAWYHQWTHYHPVSFQGAFFFFI